MRGHHSPGKGPPAPATAVTVPTHHRKSGRGQRRAYPSPRSLPQPLHPVDWPRASYGLNSGHLEVWSPWAPASQAGWVREGDTPGPGSRTHLCAFFITVGHLTSACFRLYPVLSRVDSCSETLLAAGFPDGGCAARLPLTGSLAAVRRKATSLEVRPAGPAD